MIFQTLFLPWLPRWMHVRTSVKMSGVLGKDGGPFQLHDFGKTVLRLARRTSDSLTGVMRHWCSYYTSITRVSRRAHARTETHTLTRVPSLRPAHICTHMGKVRKRRNGHGWARFWVEWNMASCAYRQSKCIWLEIFDITHGLKKTNPKNPKNKNIFLEVSSFLCP